MGLYNIYNPAPFCGNLICICCHSDKDAPHEEDCEIGNLEKKVLELETEVKELEEDMFELEGQITELGMGEDW